MPTVLPASIRVMVSRAAARVFPDPGKRDPFSHHPLGARRMMQKVFSVALLRGFQDHTGGIRLTPDLVQKIGDHRMAVRGDANRLTGLDKGDGQSSRGSGLPRSGWALHGEAALVEL